MTRAFYAVGRFQPPTVGHAAMIDRLITLAKENDGESFVFVSSTQGTGKEKLKNPLTSTEKVAFLRKMFPSGITFVDTATCTPRCGGPLAGHLYLVGKGFSEITLIAGSDRASEFGPSGQLWKSLKEVNPPTFYAVSRDAEDTTASSDPTRMSGTKARNLAMSGDYEGFSRAVKRGIVTDADVRELYDVLRERLNEPSVGTKRKRGGAEETSSFSADSEPVMGGRKTRRLKKSKASSKVLYRRGLRSRTGSSKTSRS